MLLFIEMLTVYILLARPLASIPFHSAVYATTTIAPISAITPIPRCRVRIFDLYETPIILILALAR